MCRGKVSKTISVLLLMAMVNLIVGCSWFDSDQKSNPISNENAVRIDLSDAVVYLEDVTWDQSNYTLTTNYSYESEQGLLIEQTLT